MSTETLFDKSNNFQTQAIPIKVAMADDHQLFISGISGILNEVPGFEFCASFLNGKGLLDWFSGSNADVILLDRHMPVLNGIEASKQLLTRFPSARIIILSDDYSEAVMRLIKSIGVCAYLTKSVPPENLIGAIIKVHVGEKIFDEHPSAGLSNVIAKKGNASIEKISEREIQVLKLIIEGRTNTQIASELNLSPFTIKTHRQNMLHKLNASNTAQLIAKAGLKGLI
jgi:DNA-binding NarL/FixJ family response regulator